LAKDNATAVRLLPLANEHIAELVAGVAPSTVPTETREAIVGSASGNPLFAVEFVRMLVDRVAEPPTAESVHAIIAARLDALSAEEKLLVQDAAVVGRSVWPGALARVGDRSRRVVDEHLRELVRKEFLMRVSTSSVQGETEFRFRHLLVRDVAYEQIPRVRRAEMHRRAAEWLESLSPDRTTDRAEMLAFHYVDAYEYAVAAGADTSALGESTRLALRDAGDRALALNAFGPAERHYAAAVDLWPSDDPDRAVLLLRLGKARYYADMEGADVLADAERMLLASGDREAAAEAAGFLANLSHQSGEPHEKVFEHLHRTRTLVQGLDASPTTVDLLLDLALYLVLTSEHEEAIGLANEALVDARTLELPELEARALAIIGASRGSSGDLAGRADLERSIEITEEIDSPLTSHHCGMLADLECSYGNLERCFDLQEQARGHAERFGHAAHIQWLKAELAAEYYWKGRWDEAISVADEFLADAEASGHFMEGYCRAIRARIRFARSDLDGALEDSARALDQARSSNEPQMLYPALAVRARLLCAAGSPLEAGEIVDELITLWAAKSSVFPASAWVVELAFALHALDRLGEFSRTAAALPSPTKWLEAANAFAAGEYVVAADLLAEVGSRPDEALARLRAARALADDRRNGDADRELEPALAFFGEVNATGFLGVATALPRA